MLRVCGVTTSGICLQSSGAWMPWWGWQEAMANQQRSLDSSLAASWQRDFSFANATGQRLRRLQGYTASLPKYTAIPATASTSIFANASISS